MRLWVSYGGQSDRSVDLTKANHPRFQAANSHGKPIWQVYARILPAGQLSSSHLSRIEPASTVHFWSMCIGAIAASLLLPWGWSTVDSGFMWLLMVALGAIGAVSHFLLALAYQRAPATDVVPYLYSQVGFAVLFGWIVFSELPGTLSGAGIVLIILSGLGNAWQLRQRQRT